MHTKYNTRYTSCKMMYTNNIVYRQRFLASNDNNILLYNAPRIQFNLMTL